MDAHILYDIKCFQNSGDESARDRLVERFLPLIFKSINKALMNQKNVKAEEYLSSAVEAFMQAILRLNLDQNKISSSYISQAIRWGVAKQLRKDREVKDHVAKHAQKYFMARKILSLELKREPSEDEIRDHLGVTPKIFESIKESVSIHSSLIAPKSLEDPLTDDSEGSTAIKDSIQGHSRDDVLKDIDDSAIRLFFHDVFKVLSDKEHSVIILRYFDEKNFFEISKEIGVSHQFCSVLNRKALQKIRMELVRRGVSGCSLEQISV